MATCTVKYLGTTSTGKYHKYQVVPTTTPAKGTTPAKENDHKAELEADGVQLNVNIGGVAFLSQTHLYSVPKIGDTVAVDIRAFAKNSTTTINYFHGIDKSKQEAFAAAAKLNREFAEVAAFAKKLEEFDITVADIKALEEIKLLKERRKLVSAQLKGLSDED